MSNLKKMALAAIKAGQTEAIDTPWGSALRTDYSHLLPEDFRKQGYKLGVDLMEDGSLLASQLLHPTDEFNHGTVELAVDPVNKYGTIGLASVNDEHQGKGIGKALYEAALAHSKNVLGLTHVGGGKHSSMASRVHQALARKHGLEYVPTKNIEKEGALSRYRTEEEWADREDAPFDSKYADYEYVLKAEDALFKGAPNIVDDREEIPDEQDPWWRNHFLSRITPPDLDPNYQYKIADNKYVDPIEEIEFPKAGTPEREALEGKFKEAYQRRYPNSELRPVRIPLARISDSNRVYNKRRYNLYARMAQDGDPLPPVAVQNDGRQYRLLDGNHRLNAAHKAGLTHLVGYEVVDKLDKMALADIKPGEEKKNGDWVWTDYSHLLPEAERGKYTLKVRSHASDKNEWHRAILSPVDNHHRRLGDVTFATGIDNRNEMNIVASSLMEPLRGRGLGLATYEAALAHSRNKLGATHLVGDVHSSLASAVHKKLAAKHGLDYKPKLVDPNDDSPPGAYDDKYDEYSYALKTELKKDEEKTQEPVEPEMQPLSFYLGSTASEDDIAKAKGNPDPHLRAMGARYGRYGELDHVFDYLDDPHPLVRAVATNSIAEGLVTGDPATHEHPKISPDHMDLAVDRVLSGLGSQRRPYSTRSYLAAHPLFNAEHANKIIDAAVDGGPIMNSDLKGVLIHLPEGVPENKVYDAVGKLASTINEHSRKLLQRDVNNQVVFNALHKFNKEKDTNIDHPLYTMDHSREAIQQAQSSGREFVRRSILTGGTSPLPEDLTVENLRYFAHNKFLGPEANAHLKEVFESADDADKRKMYALMANESPYNEELTNAIVEHYISKGVPHTSASGLIARLKDSNLERVREKIVDHILATPQDKEKHLEMFSEFGKLDGLGMGVKSPQMVKKLAKVAEIYPEVARHAMSSASRLGSVPLEDMLSLADLGKLSNYDLGRYIGDWAENAPLNERKKLLMALDEKRGPHSLASKAVIGLDDPGLLFSLKDPDVTRQAVKAVFPNLYLKDPEEQRAFARKAFTEGGHVRTALIQEGMFDPEDIEEHLFKKNGTVNQDLLNEFNGYSVRSLSKDQRKRVLMDIVESSDPSSGRAPLVFEPPVMKALLQKRLDEPTKAAVSAFMGRLIEKGPSPTGYNDEILQSALEENALSLRQIKQAKDAGFALRGTEEYFPNDVFSESVKFKAGTSKLREVRDKLEENPTKPTHKNNFKHLGIDLTPYTKPGTAFVDIEKVKSAIEDGDKHHYNVSHDTYDEAQLHSKDASHVFQLNLTDDIIEKLDEAGVLNTFRDMHESSRLSGHPIHEDHGIGWVRYTQASRPTGDEEDCEDCHGAGHVDCDSCDGGGVKDCHYCDGDPRNSISCPDCDGVGFKTDDPDSPDEEIECETCVGSGMLEVDCPNCDGSGELPCEDCDLENHGEGLQSCDSCEGTGKVGENRTPHFGRDHVFIDEIQSDFGQDFAKQALASTRNEIERRADENGLEGEEREAYIRENMEAAEKEAERFPPEHTKKINEILFGGMHSNEILAEAFMQWLRDNGHAGSDITMHSVDSKAPISLGRDLTKWVDKRNRTVDESEVEHMSEEERAERGIKKVKNVPGHFLLTYDKLPRKLLGMKPSTYGEFPTETGGDEWEHLSNNAKTWHKRLRKMATVATDIEKLAARYNPTTDGEAPVNHVPHMTAHPKSLNNEVKLYNEHVAGGNKPYFASSLSEGMDAKLVYEHKTEGGPKRFIVKAYHDPGESAINELNLSKGWKEMTHQALYHAGGIGDLHQKVHVVNHDYNGTKIPSVVIHVDHDSEDMMRLEPAVAYKNVPEQRKKIHLMDFLTDNQDRHLNNLRYNPEKRRLVAIDHGDTFNYRYTDPFFNYLGDDYDLKTHDALREHGAYDNTLKWWAKNSDNIKSEFARHVALIKHPELRQRTYDSFMKRANLLDKVAAAKKGNRVINGHHWIDFEDYE